MPQYSAAVRDHFHRPRNVGPLEGATHRGVAGTPGEGPSVVLWLRCEAERVQAAASRSFGCSGACASASAAAEWAMGKALN